MNHRVSAQVSQCYGELDDEIATFQAATGLHCPPGCGQCCQHPEVEATPLEMLPLALELSRQGEAMAWHARLTAIAGLSPCVLYQPDQHIPGNGRCQMYEWRPTVCRLFGFAAVKDKFGQSHLAVCARHKQSCPEAVAHATAAIAQQVPIPHFADWQMAIAQIDPAWGYERLPINDALKVAIERVSLGLAYGVPPADRQPDP